jgi:hypothetical protein
MEAFVTEPLLEKVLVPKVSSVGGSVSALAAGADKRSRLEAMMRVEMKCQIERRMGDAWEYLAIRLDWICVSCLCEVFIVAWCGSVMCLGRVSHEAAKLVTGKN